MAAYATVDDLANRWRELTADEQTRAETMLEDAAVVLRAALSHHAIEIDPDDEDQARLLTYISCSMVQRALSVSDDLMGVKQYTQTAGSYSGSYTYANSTGDIYLTTSELKWLGIKNQGMGQIRAEIHVLGGDPVDTW